MIVSWLTTRWSCAEVGGRDSTFCWVTPPPPAGVSVLQSAGITPWLLSQWPCCIRSQTQVPPKGWCSSTHIAIMASSEFGLCLAFVSLHFSCSKNTGAHFTKRFSFLSKIGQSEDGLSLLITHKCSWLTSCDVCYRAVLLVKKKKSFQLRDHPYLRTWRRWNILGVFSKSERVYTRPTNQRLGVSFMALRTAVETFMSMTIG